MRQRPTAEKLAHYGPAALLGLALAAWLFPAEFLFPRAGLDWRPVGDAAQHAIAQRHFLAAPWSWPLLAVPTLGGANLAFMDGIPALALALKPFEGPAGFHAVGLFYALAWAGQGVAAVFAARGFGLRGWLPALSVAVLALSMPAFILRYGHAALTGHALILLALGLYPRLLRDARWWAAAVALQLLALLTHPYLALMVLAMLAAVPVTLVLRGGAWVRAGLGLVAAAGAMGGAMLGLGYLGAQGDGGYGQFALNLLAPVWPRHSLFLGWLAPDDVSATGHSGWEGYNWLGLGLWAAILAALRLNRAALGAALRRHPGLALAALGCVAVAVSFRVGFGPWVLLDLGPAPGVLEQFRTSGRFFWPVAYLLLLAAAVALARAGRRGVIALAACAALQFADAAPMRAGLAAWAGERAAWTIPADRLRPVLAEARAHTLFPSWACIPEADWRDRVRLLEVLLLASETPRPVNTMYVARWRDPPRCDDAAAMAAPIASGEVRIALSVAAPALAAAQPGRCSELGELLVCR
ncbi:MAG: hypothetical protein K2X11_12505 [Acetobacteraceae bacterium]|nr:hypothetical protein [Acetobacteraceae bacterium]